AQGVAPSGLRPSREAAGGAARPARVDGEAGADIALLGKAEKTAPANAVAVYAAAPKPPAARSGGKGKIVLLGMMRKFPVAGDVWGTMQYLIGFRRLGYDVYYVEAHAVAPRMLMEGPGDNGTAKVTAFLDQVMRRFDMGGHWAYHALHDDGRCHGM